MSFSPARVVQNFRGLALLNSAPNPPDGPYTVGCTCCGRVGYHDRTQTGAVENWEAGRYLYGPVHG
ncbi:protein of unknown function [Ruminococcaceae bacterium BL-4]|nr:protein of unknown function [Ruminococcaceae bacterium BL-4]